MPGIVGQIDTISEQQPELATVDVAGATRDINGMTLANDGLKRGDWILIHAGFAMGKDRCGDRPRADGGVA